MVDLAKAVRTAGERLGVDVTALAAATAELGAPARAPRIGWWDASDRIAAIATWPAADALIQRRLGASSNTTQRATSPVLRGRRGGSPTWIAYESVPRKPNLISTAVGLPGPCDPAEEMRAIAAPVSVVTPAAAERVRALWARTGVGCDLVVDRALPPVGPNTWSFSGTIDAGTLAAAVAAVGGATGVLDAHRALAPMVATTGPTARIGIDAVFDDVLPVVWIATGEIPLEAARALVARALGDDARAAKVTGALSAAGARRASVALRLSEEDPVRVRLTAAVEAT